MESAHGTPAPRKYMAASVPRSLRQTKLSYLPSNCVIGSRLVLGDGGANLCFDIIMLPVREFTRMKSNIGLQHVIAPALKAGPTFSPSYMLTDTKEVTVPSEEPDPETFARNYFLILFGCIAPEVPSDELPQSDAELPPQQSLFSRAAKKSTSKDG